MIGWLVLLVLIAATLGGLRLAGVRGAVLKACGAAVLLGAAGYAAQGYPGLAGAPATGTQRPPTLPLADARHAFYGNFTGAEPWVTMSEALARNGNTEDAVNILQNAVRRYPNDPHLWVALGNALVEHGRGLTPPADLAYQRAAALSPQYPAPLFFRGLALARSGDRSGALALWRQILATAPVDASWRPLVEQGVEALSEPPPGR